MISSITIPSASLAMSDNVKREITDLIEAEKDRLGSYARVATKAKTSTATISQMTAGNWELIAEKMWAQVASALNWTPVGWQMAPTTNVRIVQNLLDTAKRESLFMAISHKAGSGKTASLKDFETKYRGHQVYYISCREWARREFLANLAQNLGIDSAGRAMSVDGMLMGVTEFFRQRRNARPLLILDEADKLKAAALRTLITLYNECEDGLGLIIAGTDHLAQSMNRDARYNRKGSEELLSRFGRKFQTLVGATASDVEAICTANGVQDKAVARAIFQEGQPVKRMWGNRSVEVVEDMRHIKRLVQREILKSMKMEAPAE